MCSSAAPSWYLPESGSCSTKPTWVSVRRIPCAVAFARSSSPAISTTPRRRDRPDSSLSTAAARSIDWIVFISADGCPSRDGAATHQPLGGRPLDRPAERLLNRRVRNTKLSGGARAVIAMPVEHRLDHRATDRRRSPERTVDELHDRGGAPSQDRWRDEWSP